MIKQAFRNNELKSIINVYLEQQGILNDIIMSFSTLSSHHQFIWGIQKNK